MSPPRSQDLIVDIFKAQVRHIGMDSAYAQTDLRRPGRGDDGPETEDRGSVAELDRTAHASHK